MNLPKYRETQRRLFYPCPLPHVSLSVYISNLPLSFLTNLQGSTEVWFVTPYGHIAKIKNKCVKKCKHKNTIRINGITTPTRPNKGLIVTSTFHLYFTIITWHFIYFVNLHKHQLSNKTTNPVSSGNENLCRWKSHLNRKNTQKIIP